MAEDLKADYCVVGSGPAGAILAATLIQAGESVILMEQGGRYSQEERQRSVLEPRATISGGSKANAIDKHLHPGAATIVSTAGSSGAIERPMLGKELAYRLCHANGVGGGSLHWHGTSPRPTISDLTMKTSFGRGVDWPISYQELEPWLLRAEYELGVSGNDDNPFASPRSGPFPMPSVPQSYFNREIWAPAAQRLGWTPHSNPHAIASQPWRGRSSCLACRWCSRCQSGARYAADQNHIPAFESAPNGRLVANTRLRRLELSSDGKRIVAAHAIRVLDRQPVVITARTYVLALGGVETPRMLLLSAGRGDHSQGLGNMGGQIGQRFGDMIFTAQNVALDRKIGQELGFSETTTDYFRDHGRRDHGGFMFYAFPQVVDGSRLPEPYATVQDGYLDLDELRRRATQTCFIHAEAETGWLGNVRLDPDKLDYWGDPVVRVVVKLDEWAMDGLTVVQEVGTRIAESMGAVAIGEMVATIDAAHPWGATPMAHSPDTGVCDVDLRVFGVDNLFVVSGSVFPYRGANNPTLLIVALALRLANHLIGDRVP